MEMFNKLMEMIEQLRNDPTPEQLEEAVQRLIRLESDIGNLTVIAQRNKDLWENILDQKNQELARLRAAAAKDNEEICQALGKALHYPWFKDDQKNFPGASDEAGVCVGEHVAASIADEAAKWIERAWPLINPIQTQGHSWDASPQGIEPPMRCETKCGTDHELLSHMIVNDSSHPWVLNHEERSDKGVIKIVTISRFESLEAATYFLTYDESINAEDRDNGLYSVEGPVNGDFT